MIGLFDVPKLAIAAAIGFLVCYLVSSLFWLPNARQEAVADERTAVMARAIDVLKERGKNDAQLSRMDNAGLCLELGGMPDGDICN